MQTDNPFALQITSAQISESDALALQSSFLLFLQEAETWKAKAASINVTSVEDKAAMKEARAARLALKEIRCNVENKRKDLKEDSLRKGKAIDSVANFIKGIIEPLEAHLQAQEDFVKLEEEKRLAAVVEDRSQKVRIYGFDPAVFDLKGMPEEKFQALLADCKAKDEAKQAADERAEQERKERERKDAEEREKIHAENERLKAEAEAERTAKEKAEAELRAKREEEERQERERKKAERHAQLAPDRDKLLQLATDIAGVKMPEVISAEAKRVVAEAIEQLARTSQFVKTRSISL